MKIYLIGSLRNPKVADLASKLEADLNAAFAPHTVEVWCDWFGAGYEADDKWQAYETARGRSMVDAIMHGDNAEHVWSYDKKHLDESQIAILMLPAGKSGHLELGYMIGTGKNTVVYFDKEPERWDVMYKFCDMLVVGYEDLRDYLLSWPK